MPYKLIFRGLLILFFAATIGIAIYSDYQIDNAPVDYSIGVIVDFERGAKVAPWFVYEFHVAGKQFKGRYSITEAKINAMKNDAIKDLYLNKKFFVKFSEGNPEVNRLMLEVPVPEKMPLQPVNGWDELPIDRK